MSYKIVGNKRHAYTVQQGSANGSLYGEEITADYYIITNFFNASFTHIIHV